MDTHLSICFSCLWSCFVFRFVLTWLKVLEAEHKMENGPPEFGRVAHYLVQVLPTSCPTFRAAAEVLAQERIVERTPFPRKSRVAVTRLLEPGPGTFALSQASLPNLEAPSIFNHAISRNTITANNTPHLPPTTPRAPSPTPPNNHIQDTSRLLPRPSPTTTPPPNSRPPALPQLQRTRRGPATWYKMGIEPPSTDSFTSLSDSRRR